jgi:porin
MKRVCFYGFVLVFLLLCNVKLKSQDIVEMHAGIISDFMQNISGGIQQGGANVNLIDLTASINTNKLWPGGTFALHAHHILGNQVSENMIGDIQVVSNIDGYSNRFIYELWYKQVWGQFSVLTGLHNLNNDFNVSFYSSDFLNSSFGVMPTLSLNHPISIYPITTLGSLLRWDNKSVSVLGGIYNLNDAINNENSFDIDNHIFEKGFYSLAEFQYRILDEEKIKYEFKAGSSFSRCSGFSDECISKNSLSFYALADMQLFENENKQTIGAFVQSGYNVKRTQNVTPFYWGTGFNLKGFLTRKKSDMIGLAVASASINHFDEDYSAYRHWHKESVIELTAKLQCFSFLTLHPDFQYIINPSGTTGLADAFVGILRAEISIR